MTSKENTPSPSLEEIASANKDEFDTLFSTQMALGQGITRQSQATTPTTEAGATTSVGPHIWNLLQETYGDKWSHEVIEHTVEPSQVRVLCRLTANGHSRTEFGTTINDGNIGICLQRATDNALAHCHSNLAPEAHADFVSAGASKTDYRSIDLRNIDTPAHKENRSWGQVADVRSGEAIRKAIPHCMEVAFENTIGEMEAVLLKGAMSNGIRNLHDFGCVITDRNGLVLAGKTECDLSTMLDGFSHDIHPGDVILHNDPYGAGGAGGHLNDWVIVTPIFFGEDIVGYSSSYGHMSDIGSPAMGSTPLTAQSLFGEGLRIPPIKLYSKGDLNHGALSILNSNSRTPRANHNDVMALIASTRAGEARIVQLCTRFGKATYHRGVEILMDRSRQALRSIIRKYFPPEPQSFEDTVDDDGCGNGPVRIRATIWREGDKGYLDWTGTDAQTVGPINLHLQETVLKQIVTEYLLRRIDPSMKPNSGGHSLLDITLPAQSLINASFPAALGNRQHSLSRLRDVLNGVFSYSADELVVSGGEGHYGRFAFAPTPGKPLIRLTETHYGGIPARPDADGIDGPAWRSSMQINSIEDMEHRAPIRIESRLSVSDSAGQGTHRGGNGVSTVYQFTEPGIVSISDDRHDSRPWGIFGGHAGARSRKYLTTKDGQREELASKSEHVAVFSGDKITYTSPGTGGWGDPLRRPIELVHKDVARGLVTPLSAKEDYGVVIDTITGAVASDESEALRRRLQGTQPSHTHFDFGKNTRRES